jgi:phytoene dehydrogenase-like protein
MKNKKVIIIGAGISGQATGCYAEINQYDSEIFEMHNLPGGLYSALLSGRNIIQILCNKDKKKFKS